MVFFKNYQKLVRRKTARADLSEVRWQLRAFFFLRQREYSAKKKKKKKKKYIKGIFKNLGQYCINRYYQGYNKK